MYIPFFNYIGFKYIIRMLGIKPFFSLHITLMNPPQIENTKLFEHVDFIL